jgi:arylsulfatase A-like enzyme
MHLSKFFIAAMLAAATIGSSLAHAETAHNVILFVPDGLRSQIVDAATAPAMARLRTEGVNFHNSHSLFPTFTTANASAFATGHGLGDTGDFSNTIYTEWPIQGTVTSFLENDPVLRELHLHRGGNYLHEASIVAAARAKNFSAAVIGKLGPVAIFDPRAVTDGEGLVIDDMTGDAVKGIALSPEWVDAIKAAKLKPEAMGRGENGNGGDNHSPGTWIANLGQQQYFLELTTKVILPRFKAANRPFVLVYWSRDPDGSQHNQGDSFKASMPGINGDTSMAAIRTADAALAAIEATLKSLDLYRTTDIIVAADHGFSSIGKESKTSPAAQGHFADVDAGELPSGFLAMDVAAALRSGDASLRLFDPDDDDKLIEGGDAHPSKGNGVIGKDPQLPLVVVAANGGSDLIYIPTQVPTRKAKALAAQIVRALLQQDYLSGIFVDAKRFGEIPGALGLHDIGLDGSAVTAHPAIVANFRSFSTPCGKMPVLCAVEIADTRLQPGQGMHGSFSRADTWNFMAARGPDFRKGFVDEIPASNADIGATLAYLLGIELKPIGSLKGRVLLESLTQGSAQALPAVMIERRISKPGGNGLRTVLNAQTVGSSVYFDSAGFAGLTVGLDAVR